MHQQSCNVNCDNSLFLNKYAWISQCFIFCSRLCVFVSTAQPSLSELLKPKTPQWQCKGCYLSHDKKIVKCPACGQTQPGVTLSDTQTATTTTARYSVCTLRLCMSGENVD